MTYDPIDTGPNDSDADREVTLGGADIGDTSLISIEPDGTINVPDDVKISFGDDDDYRIHWVSAQAALKIHEDGGDFTGFEMFTGEVRVVNADLIIPATSTFDLKGNDIRSPRALRFNSRDVTSISSPQEGWVAYHDGSGSETEGPAFFDGDNWVSTVDGTTITNP